MARPDKDKSLKKKPRTFSATDNEWAQLKKKAKDAKRDTSKYILEKLKIKDEPLSLASPSPSDTV